MYLYNFILTIIVMRIGDDGQISVDFLLGLSIFMVFLGFVIQFIPGLFITITGEGNLNSVAYRTANILAEDPGWWENSTQNGTDWEMNLNDISRIGLAADASPGTRLTQTPNLLNRKKILTVLQLHAANESILTSKLGLYDVISSSRIDYGYNITVEKNGALMFINGTPVTFGKPIPEFQDVFKITRIVLVENGIIAGFRAEELIKPSINTNQTARINITGPQTENVSIQISNLTQNSTFIDAYKNNTLINPSDFTVRKETISGDFAIYNLNDPLNETDLLLLNFDHNLFTSNAIYQLDLNFTQMNFTRSGPPYSEYASRVEPLYEPATLMVKVWK